MKFYLKEAGIHYRLTVPHTPQQNGVAEHKSWIVLEAARCILIESRVESFFWVEAISTSNYIKNRCLTKGISEGTPYEKWHGQRPNISHLQIFVNKVFRKIEKLFYLSILNHHDSLSSIDEENEPPFLGFKDQPDKNDRSTPVTPSMVNRMLIPVSMMNISWNTFRLQ